MTEWVGEWVSECVNECVSEWVGECMSEQTRKWVSEWVIAWVSLSERMSEWLSEWVSNWVCEWIVLLNKSIKYFKKKWIIIRIKVKCEWNGQMIKGKKLRKLRREKRSVSCNIIKFKVPSNHQFDSICNDTI